MLCFTDEEEPELEVDLVPIAVSFSLEDFDFVVKAFEGRAALMR